MDPNQAYLEDCFGRLRSALEALLGAPHRYDPALVFGEADPAPPDTPPAAWVAAERFGLGRFELWMLLLAAGCELDPRIAELCAGGFGKGSVGFPTTGLALKLLPEAHWSALTPAAPLRYWRLIELDRSGPLSGSTFRIDERVLHYLIGLNYLDAPLWDWARAVMAPLPLAPSQAQTAREAADAWFAALAQDPRTVLQLVGSRRRDRQAVAIWIAAAAQLTLVEADAERLPAESADAWSPARLWSREARLSGHALVVHGGRSDPDPGRTRRLAALVEEAGLVIVAGSRKAWSFDRPVLRFEVEPATRLEQLEAWCAALPEGDVLRPQLTVFVGQFDLDLDELGAVAASVQGLELTPDQQMEHLRDRSRTLLRTELDGLAHRIPTSATWDRLVVSDAIRDELRDLAQRVRTRITVQDRWGVGRRGGGVSILLSGPSGTGKTLAAEVLAHELDLDLYAVDLSAIVSKYIGETEENLSRLFDAAERMGAVLLFDEADALFGKRTEVRSSHDRHANIEVSYLLHRMESFSGVAVLTTNFKAATDRAFLRRFSAILDFEFPDQPARRRIWEVAIPAGVPREELDLDRLSDLQATGGQIQAIVLHALHLAAGDGEVLAMRHLDRATEAQFRKVGRPLSTPVG